MDSAEQKPTDAQSAAAETITAQAPPAPSTDDPQPIITETLPLSLLYNLREGGVSFDGLSVRVNASAITAEKLAARVEMPSKRPAHQANRTVDKALVKLLLRKGRSANPSAAADCVTAAPTPPPARTTALGTPCMSPNPVSLAVGSESMMVLPALADEDGSDLGPMLGGGMGGSNNMGEEGSGTAGASSADAAVPHLVATRANEAEGHDFILRGHASTTVCGVDGPPVDRYNDDAASPDFVPIVGVASEEADPNAPDDIGVVEGETGGFRSPTAASPFPTQHATVQMANRYGDDIPEDSVRIERGSVSSPIPTLYTPIAGFGSMTSNQASRLDMTGTVNLGTLVAEKMQRLRSAGSAASMGAAPRKLSNATTADGPIEGCRSGSPGAHTADDSGKTTAQNTTNTTNTTANREPGFLDCFYADTTDATSNAADLESILGAISYAIHRDTSHGARYAAVVKRLYGIGDEGEAKKAGKKPKSKLPIEKLFKCLAKPHVVYKGTALEFLILEDVESSLYSATTANGTDSSWSGMMSPTSAPDTTTHTAYFSHAADLHAAKLALREKATQAGSIIKGPALDLDEPLGVNVVLVCLRLRRASPPVASSMAPFSPFEGAASPLVLAQTMGADGRDMLLNQQAAGPTMDPTAGTTTLGNPLTIDVPTAAPTLLVSWTPLRYDASLWKRCGSITLLPFVAMRGADPLAASAKVKSMLRRRSTGSSDDDSQDDDDSDAELFDESNTSGDSPHGLQDERRIVLAKKDFVAEGGEHVLPFDGLIYPTLDMADTGYIPILVRSMHSSFLLNRIRLPSTMICLVAMIAFASAILHITMHALDACCVHDSMLTDVGDRMCLHNLTDAGIAEMLLGQCEIDMCRDKNGRLSSQLPKSYMWGDMLSNGRLLVLIIAGAIVTMLISTLVSFFSTRPVAVGGGIPRFVAIPYLLELASGGLMAAAAVAIAIDFYEPNHIVRDCGVFGAQSQLAALCRAEYDNCDVKFVINFDGNADGKHLKWLAIVLSIFSLLHCCFAILPPLLRKASRDAIPPAVPDTMIFKVGRYAPDGISEKEIIDLQRQIKARWRRERWQRAARQQEADEFSRVRATDLFVRNRDGAHATGKEVLQEATRQTRLKMNVLKRWLGGKQSSGTHTHHPDPTFKGLPTYTLPQTLKDTIDDISNHVLDRMRAGDVPHHQGSSTSTRGWGSTFNGGSPREMRKNTTVWDKLVETTDAVTKERMAANPGNRFFKAMQQMDPRKMDAHVHESDSLQRKVIDTIATRVATDALRLQRQYAGGSAGSAGPMGSPTSIFPPSMMVQAPKAVPTDRRYY